LLAYLQLFHGGASGEIAGQRPKRQFKACPPGLRAGFKVRRRESDSFSTLKAFVDGFAPQSYNPGMFNRR